MIGTIFALTESRQFLIYTHAHAHTHTLTLTHTRTHIHTRSTHTHTKKNIVSLQFFSNDAYTNDSITPSIM